MIEHEHRYYPSSRNKSDTCLICGFRPKPVIFGNCLEVLKDFEDVCIDLTVTSPPYDNLRTYNGYFFDFEGIARELYRVTKDGGVVVWVVGDSCNNFCESLTSFKQAIFFVEKCGFNLLDTMIYYKNNYAPAYPGMKRYANQFEYMFIFSKGKPNNYNPVQEEKKEIANGIKSYRQPDGSLKKKILLDNGRKTKDASNVWRYSVGGKDNGHPAPFPEKLAEDHILSWSNEGDTVLDPFAGSGTTLKMAKKNNRKYIGIEISEEYIKIIEKRLEGLTQNSLGI